MKKGIILILIACIILMNDHVKADTMISTTLNDNLYANNVGTWNYNNWRIFEIPIVNNELFGGGNVVLTDNSNNSIFYVPQAQISGKWYDPYQVQFQIRIDYSSYFTFIDGANQNGQNYNTEWFYRNGLTMNFKVNYKLINNATSTGLCSTNFANNDGPKAYYTIKCNVPQNVDYIQNITINYEFGNSQYGQGQANNFAVGISDKLNYMYSSDISAIIESQNNNTQAILNENTTYNSDPSENITGQDDMNEFDNTQRNILNNLDFSGINETGNITINGNANSFIWNIVTALRNMNVAIVTLMTSILGIGLIKMVLNR